MADTTKFHSITGFVGSAARPTVVTLCGSTRFKKLFKEVARDLTFQGIIVISVGTFEHKKGKGKEERLGVEVAAALDELHKRKIDISDGIFVVNPERYIGQSTAGEILYAEAHGKFVQSIEALPDEHELQRIAGGIT